MAGTLTVQNLQGPSSGANANKVIIPSGQTLDASNGFVAPAGSVVQTIRMTPTSTAFSTASTSYLKTNLALSITPKYANSLIKIEMSCTLLNQGDELDLRLYRNGVDIALQTQIHGDYDGSGTYTTTALMYTDLPNTTSSTEYALYAKVLAGSNGGTGYVYREQHMLLQEIAQ